MIKMNTVFVDGQILYSDLLNQIVSNLNDLETTSNTKVDKIEGKSLSTEDFSTEFKRKLSECTNYTSEQINGFVTNLQTQIDGIIQNGISKSISLGQLKNVDPTADSASVGAILVKGTDGIYYPNTNIINNLTSKVYTLDINDTPQNMFNLLNENKFNKFVVIGVNETDGSETFDSMVNYTPTSIRVSWYEGFIFKTLLLEKNGDTINKTTSYIDLTR